VSVDLNSNNLIVAGRATLLRPKDAELMAVLLKHHPRVATIDGLIAGIWGHNEPDSVRNVLRINIHRLRKALEGTNVHIMNVVDVGYRVVIS
jgi:DNA-binding response OmpR family regulator